MNGPRGARARERESVMLYSVVLASAKRSVSG